jgi:hypothetical protein
VHPSKRCFVLLSTSKLPTFKMSTFKFYLTYPKPNLT